MDNAIFSLQLRYSSICYWRRTRKSPKARRCKPYGELLAGTATTYGWTGNTGSRATLLQYAEQYNRRR